MQRVLPEVVNVDPVTGILSVSYTEIIPVVIEAFKQHMQEYAKEKQGVRDQLDGMRNRLERLEKSMCNFLRAAFSHVVSAHLWELSFTQILVNFLFSF